MSVLAAFMSTWSNARSTFGQNAPQTGAHYDNSGTLRQLQSDLGSAASGTRWTGTAASAYDTANTEHRRVIGEIAGLVSAVEGPYRPVGAGGHHRPRQSRRRAPTGSTAAAASDAAEFRGRKDDAHRLCRKASPRWMNIVQTSNGDLNAIGGEDSRGLDPRVPEAWRSRVRKRGGWTGFVRWRRQRQKTKVGNRTTSTSRRCTTPDLLNEETDGLLQEVARQRREAWRAARGDRRDRPAAQKHRPTQSFDVLNNMERVEDRGPQGPTSSCLRGTYG